MDKKEIEEFLKELEVFDLVQNLQIVGSDVFIDMWAHSPAMHEKVKLEKAMKAAFQQKFNDEISLKLTIKTPTQEIRPTADKKLPNIKNVIAIASGKGGVGKSTVSANVAVSLAQMGFKVGLLDADIYGPSQPTMFDVVFEKPKSVEVNGRNLMKPIESHGVKLLSIGFFANNNQAVVWRGPMASKALHQMIHDADWGELDFLIIDLPPGTGDVHLSIVQEIPVTGAVIVSSPQNIATIDAQKAASMFTMESINVPILGFVENMSYFTPEELPNNKYYIFGKDGVKAMAEQLQLPFLGEIPIATSIREAADVGNPAVLQKDTEWTSIYNEVTKNMLQQLLKRNTELPESEVVKITTMSGCSA